MMVEEDSNLADAETEVIELVGEVTNPGSVLRQIDDRQYPSTSISGVGEDPD